MTIRYVAKCDLCGKEHELGFGRKLTETPGQFERPDGWQVLTYTPYTKSGITVRMDIMVCPRCDKAISEGRTVVSAYLNDELTSEPVRIYTEPNVIPLSDKFPEVNEEEANL